METHLCRCVINPDCLWLEKEVVKNHHLPFHIKLWSKQQPISRAQGSVYSLRTLMFSHVFCNSSQRFSFEWTTDLPSLLCNLPQISSAGLRAGESFSVFQQFPSQAWQPLMAYSTTTKNETSEIRKKILGRPLHTTYNFWLIALYNKMVHHGGKKDDPFF